MKRNRVLIAVLTLIVIILIIILIVTLVNKGNNNLNDDYVLYYLEKNKVANFDDISLAENDLVNIYVNYNKLDSTELENALINNVQVLSLMDDSGKEVNYSDCTNIAISIPIDVHETLTMLSLINEISYNLEVSDSSNNELNVNDSLKQKLESNIDLLQKN